MKKLLIATSIVAMSSTAMAANDDTRMGESIKTETLAISANYIELLTLNLQKTTIDFGDVFTAASVDAVTVTADVTGDADETFTYNISTVADSHVLINGNDVSSTPFTLASQVLTDGAVTFNFTVDLDTTSGIIADVSENVTVTITYDAIEATSFTPV